MTTPRWPHLAAPRDDTWNFHCRIGAWDVWHWSTNNALVAYHAIGEPVVAAWPDHRYEVRDPRKWHGPDKDAFLAMIALAGYSTTPYCKEKDE